MVLKAFRNQQAIRQGNTVSLSMNDGTGRMNRAYHIEKGGQALIAAKTCYLHHA
jgi:hypothetical protein